MPEASIIGWAHSPFGKLEAEPDLESLITRVARAAIEDAGISAAEIDAGLVGHAFALLVDDFRRAVRILEWHECARDDEVA